MKRLYYLAIVLISLCAACSGEKNNNENTQSTEVRVDSFYTPDLAFAQLRGPVSQCVTRTSDAERKGDSLIISEDPIETIQTLKFNKDGQITDVIYNMTFGGEAAESSSYTFEYNADGDFVRAFTSEDGILRFRRNADGTVKTFSNTGITGNTEFIKAYTWDGKLLTAESDVNTDKGNESDNGKTMGDARNKITYTYDAQGYRTGSFQELGDPEFENTEIEVTFNNEEFDSHGNWIRRSVTTKGSIYEGSLTGKGALRETKTTYQIETRQITYYE